MKYYAVRAGKVPGVYTSWDLCKEMVNGYSGAEFKSFASLEEAQKYVGQIEEKIRAPLEQPHSIYLQPRPTYASRQRQLSQLTGVIKPVVTTVSIKPFDEKESLSTVVYFDGSCRNKVAGAACYFPDTCQVYYGKLAGEGTNSRAELYGLILALTRTDDKKLIVYGDSTYALNQGSGAHKAKANFDLVAEIRELVKDRDIDFRHVYGHSGQRENEICDSYAAKALTLESTVVLDEYVPNNRLEDK